MLGLKARGRLLLAGCVAAGALVLGPVARSDEVVGSCGVGQANYIWSLTGAGNATCTLGALNLYGAPGSTASTGQLTANAPSGLAIVGTPMALVMPSEQSGSTTVYDHQWETQYVWPNGVFDTYYPATETCPVSADACSSDGPLPTSFAPSPYLQLRLSCAIASCSDSATDTFPAPDLLAVETQNPTLAAHADTLGADLGWIRGTWPLNLSGDSPSGLCSIQASINGLGVGHSSSVQDTGRWKQCSDTSLAASVDTTKFPDGTDTFTASAGSAAGNTASITQPLHVDNSTPSVALSGPADVPAGSAPAQLTATATAGPSGVGEIDCNVDGTNESFPGGGQSPATATIAFTGIGAHAASCVADSTAVAPDGTHIWSPVGTGAQTVRTPTAALASFSKLVDRRICRTEIKRVEVPAGWHEIRWHGHRVKARLPAHRARKHVRVCHERLVRRRIVVYKKVRRGHRTVRVKRHRVVKVPIAPHTVTRGIRTVAFGHATHVSGTLLTTAGVALADQPVTVMGAPRTGHGTFRALAGATTDVNGYWHAKIPRGPGRVLEAVYGGTPTTEPTISDQVRTIVHARVELGPIRPARVPWHGRITLRGRLPGGHVPHKGINVRLVYGLGRHSTTYAVHQHVGARHHDAFTAHFRFGAGPARAHATFFFQICTLPSAAYPFAVGCSAKRTVRVGGHPHVHRAARR
jgi:hypothetical protein